MSRQTTTAAAAPKTVRGIVARKRTDERMRITAYVDPELGQRLKVHAVVNGREQSDVIAQALREYLARQPAR